MLRRILIIAIKLVIYMYNYYIFAARINMYNAAAKASGRRPLLTKYANYIKMWFDLCGQAFPEFMRLYYVLPSKFTGKVIFCREEIKFLCRVPEDKYG